MGKGGEVIVTSGFYRAMQDKGVRNIFEMYATDRKANSIRFLYTIKKVPQTYVYGTFEWR